MNYIIDSLSLLAISWKKNENFYSTGSKVAAILKINYFRWCSLVVLAAQRHIFWFTEFILTDNIEHGIWVYFIPPVWYLAAQHGGAVKNKILTLLNMHLKLSYRFITFCNIMSERFPVCWYMRFCSKAAHSWWCS